MSQNSELIPNSLHQNLPSNIVSSTKEDTIRIMAVHPNPQPA
jgi:hypothetical protein